jgi:hypothetical protein
MAMFNRPRLGLFMGPRGVRVHDRKSRQSLPSANTLSEALAPLHGSRARLEIVLSDAHCRYLVVARPKGIRSRAELEAAAGSRFKAVFGDARPWTLKVDALPSADADFIAGVDRAVLDDIERAAQAAGLTVTSIQPHWVAWARHLHRATRSGPHWLVCSDGEWASLAYLSQGQCRHVRALRLDAGLGDVDSMLARERAFAGDVDANAAIWVCGVGPFSPEAAVDGTRVTAVDVGALWGVSEGVA